MSFTKFTTLGELKNSGYVSKSIKDEIRENLIKKIKAKEKAIFKYWRTYGRKNELVNA